MSCNPHALLVMQFYKKVILSTVCPFSFFNDILVTTYIVPNQTLSSENLVVNTSLLFL
ncbi:hypothetical protein MtrunA17_Chr7g0275071 [Medicago truncatula]|uniref:Uncharacterized protein n=1 Tax=Medicago truncatula TaxID=3880 RepID=A0A396H9W0_MEDTR|nr:hypothetical protein MtrunA17_Chr7g0275071 [Medicago truncatula]